MTIYMYIYIWCIYCVLTVLNFITTIRRGLSKFRDLVPLLPFVRGLSSGSKCREYAAGVHTGTLYGSQTWPVEIGRYDQTREE